MALKKAYNPPPNWPQPPDGWSPPAGWTADPGWGPAPEGWEFWRQERANPWAWAYSAAWAGVLLVVLLSIGSIAARTPPTPYVFGLIFGRCLFTWLITGLIAWVSTSRWSVWFYPLITVGIALGLGVLVYLGHQTPS